MESAAGMASPENDTRQRIAEQMDRVADIFIRSHTIRSACDILHTHVLDPGLTGEAVEDCRFFLRNMLRCLFLYGFCVYHVGRKRKGRDDGRSVLVADHSKITLSFSNGEWIPQFRSDSEPETGRARMIMWRRPSLDFGIDSPAWAGLIPGERLEGLLQNIRCRDALNSKRALYTAFEQLQATSSGQPWFTGAANQGYTGLYGFGATQELDVDELISNREDMHSQLGMMTKRLQLQQFAAMPAGGSFASILPEIRDEEHQEFMISDGSKGLFQASHLAGENDLRGIIRSLQIDTFIATGTPPQAAGVNSNTERVAGSERITNFALDSFDRRGAELRVIAEPVLDEIFGVKFGEVLDVAMLGRLMPILTDESAMRLAARAYKVQESSIDPQRLGIMRDALLEVPGSKSGVGTPIAPKNKDNDNAAKDEVQKAEDHRQKADAKALL